MTDPRMPDWPEVTMADALADQQFFYDHPDRRYRTRPAADGRIWVVRRRQRDTFLRTLARTKFRYSDTDEALRQLWFETAWSELDPKEREALLKEARKAERAAARQVARWRGRR